MKKGFKILTIIVIVVAIIISLVVGGFFLKEFIEDKKLENERINKSTTLSKYIEYHDTKHTGKGWAMEFYAKDISLDLLNNHNIIYYDGNILILDDYTIFETIFNSEKLFSNNQKYKTIETDFKIKRILLTNYLPILLTTDNEVYRINKNSDNVITFDKQETKHMGIDYLLILDNSIKKVVNSNYDNEKQQHKVSVLKNDGNVYTQYYDQAQKILLKEEILLSNTDYGNIYDIMTDSQVSISLGTWKDLNSSEIVRIVSDKGLFSLKYIETEESKKYADVKPTFEMVKSDIYNKYKDDVLYINSQYVFTKDNNIIETLMLCQDIDKEVK